MLETSQFTQMIFNNEWHVPLKIYNAAVKSQRVGPEGGVGGVVLGQKQYQSCQIGGEAPNLPSGYRTFSLFPLTE